MRKKEYFIKEIENANRKNASSVPSTLYRQERDWTCSIACLRTITSSITNIGSEDDIISKLCLKPGPYYSRDIKHWGILDNLRTYYGCDYTDLKPVGDLTNLMLDGYFVMVECMVNYDHWLVLLNYLKVSDNPEEDMITLYDPYYNEVKLMRADEFNGMWCSGEHENNRVLCDFIAVAR